MIEVLDQPVFPRNIMTSDYSGFFPVHDTNEMFNAFERAQFKDCRISAYPPVKTRYSTNSKYFTFRPRPR